MKARRLRVGDRVIVQGDMRPVIRVGYPKDFADYLAEAEKLRPALRGLLGTKWIGARALRRLDSAVAYVLAAKDGFGGPARTLHFGEPLDRLRGKSITIRELRTVQTGTYYPPSGRGDDYEPGGLSDRVTRRLACVEYGFGPIRQAKTSNLPGTWYPVEALQLVGTALGEAAS